MKKALLASSALLLTAGIAAADVTISGSARFGLEFLSPNEGDSSTTLDHRLRFNIDASKETDIGVKFGGRIRLQYDNGTGYLDNVTDDGEDGLSNNDGGGAQLSAAYVYAEVSGFHVEVGNVSGAFDSAGLLYASEVGDGYYSSDSVIRGSFYGFSTGPYSSDEINRTGIYAQYEMGDFVARLSYITPDQSPGADTDDEVSVSFDYSTGPFAVSLGAAQNGNGIADNDLFFLGAQYALNDTTNVGLLYNDASDSQSITLYGSTSFNAITVDAYISSVDSDDIEFEEDIAVGIGASYDLGGASIGAAIEQNHSGDTLGRVGVSFSF